MRFKTPPPPPQPKWGTFKVRRLWVPIMYTDDGYTVVFGFVYLVSQFRGIAWHDSGTYSTREAAESFVSNMEKTIYGVKK